MAFISKHEFIIKNKEGIIFNFYLNEEFFIEYIASNKEGKWVDKEVIFGESTESLHIQIDNNDNIHIISYHSNGDLYYHMYNNSKWENYLLTNYPPKEQKVLYPIIKYINKQVHIFYLLLNNNEKNKAYLLHLNFEDEKYNTHHIDTIYFHSYINPFKVFLKNNNIILIYTSIVKNHDQIILYSFNKDIEGSGYSIELTSSKDNKIYLDGLLDKDNLLHMVWSRYDEENLKVHYLKLDIDKEKKEDFDLLNPISLSFDSSSSFPNLILQGKVLWSTWTEMSKIVSCYSLNMGSSWSMPYINEDTKKIDFKRYRYISNSLNEEAYILCDFIFGTLYPDIKFLGFGGEIYDEIPTS